MGRKLQSILYFSLLIICASFVLFADPKFSTFNFYQAFAGAGGGPAGPVEVGDILVVDPFSGLCIPFPPCGERFGAVFDINRSTGEPTKVVEFSFISSVTGFPGETTKFELGIKMDPEGNLYVLDQLFAFINSDGSTRSTNGAILQTGYENLFGAEGGVVDTSNFNLVGLTGLGPIPLSPWAIDVSSSSQVYFIGAFTFHDGALLMLDPTDCSFGPTVPFQTGCERIVVSSWQDPTQGPVWPPQFPEVEKNNFEDLAFPEAPVPAAVHNTAYVLERHVYCNFFDPFDPNDCLQFATTPRVWAVDVTTGNREIINTFNDANEGPTLFGIPKSIEVLNSGNLLVSTETQIYEINPNTKNRSLFSDLTDATQGVTGGNWNRGIEVERSTGQIFALGPGLIQINPTNGFRTLVSDLSFTFSPGDTFTLSPQDLTIVSFLPDSDGDGVPDNQDTNDNDPCVPNITNSACDADMDGVPGDQDPNNNDPCNPDPNSPACDSDGDGVPQGSDNCPDNTNSSQNDLDNDGTGDACDVLNEITTSKTITTNHSLIGNLIVKNGAVLTIPNSLSITIPNSNNLQVQNGGGVLIESGGSLRVG